MSRRRLFHRTGRRHRRSPVPRSQNRRRIKNERRTFHKSRSAKANDAFDVPIHQAEAKTVDHREKSYGSVPLDHDQAQSVEVEFSFLEKDSGVAKASLSNSAISDDKHDMKVPDTHSVSISYMKTSDMKRSDMKIRGRQRTAVERRSRGRTTFEQASLEIRNTSACSGSQSCSGDVPRLFGVRF